jgi:hypothetical protein
MGDIKKEPFKKKKKKLHPKALGSRSLINPPPPPKGGEVGGGGQRLSWKKWLSYHYKSLLMMVGLVVARAHNKAFTLLSCLSDSSLSLFHRLICTIPQVPMSCKSLMNYYTISFHIFFFPTSQLTKWDNKCTSFSSFFCFSFCYCFSATTTTPSLVYPYGHHSSRAPLVLLWETQAPFNAKGAFFFSNKSLFVVVPDLMQELYITIDYSLWFLGLCHLCALQAFSPNIFGYSKLSHCPPLHPSS